MADRGKPSQAFHSALEALHCTALGDREWARLKAAVPELSDRALRRLARACGLPLSAAVEGVRMTSFAELERTLLALLDEYEAAAAAGDRDRQRDLRRTVIAAKSEARLGARAAQNPQRRNEMLEMADWMLTWLENPPLFRSWAELRNRAKRAQLTRLID